MTEEEIEREVLDAWLRVANDNVAIWRIINGVAGILGLSKKELIKYMPKFLPLSLLYDAKRREELAIKDAVERIAETLSDHEAWDAYSASRAPSAYRYAAAVASWLYLLAEQGGVSLSCPLYDVRVKAAVIEFLTTREAYPIADALRETLIDARNKWIRMLPPEHRETALRMTLEQRSEEALLYFCSPP